MPHDDEKTFVVVDEEESPPFTLEEFRSSNDGDPLVDMYAVDLDRLEVGEVWTHHGFVGAEISIKRLS